MYQFLFSYVTMNQQCSSSYRLYNEAVPLYLRDRPRKFVQACMKRLTSAADVRQIIREGTDKFVVQSAEAQEGYVVDVAAATCSCADYRRRAWPCKHMFAIITKIEGVSWGSLPSWYRDSVMTTLDDAVVGERMPQRPVDATASGVAQSSNKYYCRQ